MKKKYIILTLIVLVCLFLLLVNDTKKVAVNYIFDGKSMQIAVTSTSKAEIFLFAEEYLIYREKYGDTLRLSSFKNGKKSKYISFVPADRDQYVFNFFRIRHLNEERQKEMLLAFKKMDPSLYNFSKFGKFPFFQIIEPKNKIIIEYRNTLPLEKGKYKIFLDKTNHDKTIKNFPLPKEFKLLKGNEIEDNPLEFEMK